MSVAVRLAAAPSVSRCLPTLTGSLSSASPYALPPHLPSLPPVFRPSSHFDQDLGATPPRRTVAMSLITTTTTATTSYRPGHLLENNIHKVEPSSLRSTLSASIFSPSLPPLSLFTSFDFPSRFFVAVNGMTSSPIYIYGRDFVAAETTSSKKRVYDDEHKTDTWNAS